MELVSLLNNRIEVNVAVCVIAFVCILVTLWRKRTDRFPPGPFGLPVVGYLPFLTKNPHLKLSQLGDRYGHVFSIRLGSENVVVLHSGEAVREAFMKSEFLGRPQNNVTSLFGYKSLVFGTDIHVWKEQKKFAVLTLKDLGLGKSKLEANIQEEVSHFLDALKSHCGEPVYLDKLLTSSISNNICALAFGKRYDYDDAERLLLDDNAESVVRILTQTSVYLFFPWLRHLPFILRWLNYDKGIRALESSKQIIKRKIQEHRDNLDPRDVRDFIDTYLVEMQRRKERDPKTTFSEDTLIGTVLDLFGAGTETVRTHISWSIYTLAAYPDVQDKAHKEIRDVLGDRRPDFSDQKLMPYVQALILEIFRWKTITPLDLLRCTLADTTVSGYEIPRGTIVMANFWAVHHDPKVWEDPDSFKPERFLGEDGRTLHKFPNFMPFSIGKRSCPVESMVFLEIFLYIVSILQNFKVKFPEDIQKPTFEAEFAATYRPRPYKISIVSRNSSQSQ